jgi:hypothetical protein
MSESPLLDEFIRHLQAELDESEGIPNKKERQQRQWQIESALQEATVFNNRFKELTKIGKDPLEIVQAIANPNAPPSAVKQAIAKATGVCPTCGTIMEDDLNFCASCGEYLE